MCRFVTGCAENLPVSPKRFTRRHVPYVKVSYSEWFPKSLSCHEASAYSALAYSTPSAYSFQPNGPGLLPFHGKYKYSSAVVI
ncbi:hypothetical protein TNIN_271791 [Trichonephila inaurata madagascariensis]|uniref:Uncharacterized protein n=1 Tax=Trichonephila inaurata madagascariensis TaxID=2747483 RepID=A0A8X6XI81_9ARAC|nr:hypothetical protein TNIN_271761 [Trichonephila inaurata madagascariensis]GFY53140.1 hypothetical protein TNIN_271791 [Trichonephila inaurata madagascariensis]